MESKYVKLTVPKKLYQESLQLVREFGYSNIQDLTVECLRKQVIELKRQQALINLKKSFGSVKGKQMLTKAQREVIAEEHTPKKASAITKEFGLGDIKI